MECCGKKETGTGLDDYFSSRRLARPLNTFKKCSVFESTIGLQGSAVQAAT